MFFRTRICFVLEYRYVFGEHLCFFRNTDMFSECDMFFSEYRYVFGMRICFFRTTDII